MFWSTEKLTWRQVWTAIIYTYEIWTEEWPGTEPLSQHSRYTTQPVHPRRSPEFHGTVNFFLSSYHYIKKVVFVSILIFPAVFYPLIFLFYYFFLLFLSYALYSSNLTYVLLVLFSVLQCSAFFFFYLPILSFLTTKHVHQNDYPYPVSYPWSWSAAASHSAIVMSSMHTNKTQHPQYQVFLLYSLSSSCFIVFIFILRVTLTKPSIHNIKLSSSILYPHCVFIYTLSHT